MRVCQDGAVLVAEGIGRRWSEQSGLGRWTEVTSGGAVRKKEELTVIQGYKRGQRWFERIASAQAKHVKQLASWRRARCDHARATAAGK